MIKLRNVHTGQVYEYDYELGKQLARTNKFDFEIVDANEKILEEIKEEAIPTDEALILGKKRKKKSNG